MINKAVATYEACVRNHSVLEQRTEGCVMLLNT